MIVKETKESSGKAFFVIPEDSDDLFTLRRIIQVEDTIVADTTRVIKYEKEFSRPDRDRVKVRVSIKVEKISLDESIDKLRISGIITETNNDLVSKGTHHSIVIQPGENFIIDKKRKWKELELNILRSGNTGNFILVSIDTNEASIAKISGTHLKIIPNIYSGQSGKYFGNQSKNNPKIDIFFKEICDTAINLILDQIEESTMILFGPGETKRRFYNYINDKNRLLNTKILVTDGVDVAGEDGIYVFLRSPIVREVMSSSKIALVSNILDQIMIFVNNNTKKYSMGVKEVYEAIKVNSVEYLVFSDSIFKVINEDHLIKILNEAESLGSKVIAVDSSTDIGLRVSSLGGMVALLRYEIH